MSRDCRNDCIEPLIFPKRPKNRPGLSHIDYRIGTYSDFREVLLRNLNKDAVLSAWTHRGADDPGIALLEGASILGDILTFYQELFANEAYLRTAQWRESIADLVRLLGYRLSPGLGGKATFAFEVKGDKSVLIPAGFPIKAQVEGAEQPVDFETKKEFTAVHSLSKFYLYRPTYMPKFPVEVSDFSIETSALKQAEIEINKKDRLMLLDTDTNPTNNAQIVVVKEVEQKIDRTNIAIDGTWKKWGSDNGVIAYKLGRTFRHFGHNAPPEVVKLNGTKPSQKPITYNRRLHAVTQTTGNTTIEPSFGSIEIPIDNEVHDLVVGIKLIIQEVAYHEATIVRLIEGFRAASMTWGALSGATTIVTINDEMDDLRYGHSHTVTDIRKLIIHETVGRVLTLTNKRQADSSADGKQLYYYGDNASYKQLNNRRLAFVKEDGTAMETIVEALNDNSSGDNKKEMRPLSLNTPLGAGFILDDFPLDKPKVTVYGNLVDATQGKTEKEAVLGNGDNRQEFQTFKLPKAPLTYHNSPGETPPEVPELQIYVNDRLWKRAPSFFGRGPKEEIYIVREDVNGESWVQLGDGKTGARLPSGIRNVVAKYRTGTGAYGALKEETTVQPGGKLNRLDKIQLHGVASGGSEPESGDNAREAAPGKIQSLDRLVSLKDFESEALAISGVTKVKATWDLVDNTPAVVLTVLMETGRDAEFSEVQGIINNYNKCRGPQRFHVDVRKGKRLYVYIDAAFGLHPAFREELVKKSIKEALGISGEEGNGIDGSHGLFGLPERQFGQNEYATRIEGIIQNVEGVVWAEVKALGFLLGEADDPAELILPPEPKPLNQVVSCDNVHIFNLYKDHLQLKGSKVESTEEC